MNFTSLTPLPPPALVRPAARALPLLALALAALALLLAPAPDARAAMKWLPVEKADLDATASEIDPSADSEILFRLVEIDDKAEKTTTYRYYRRVKIFNEKGVREFDKVDIETPDTIKLRYILARVIKPDGTIVNIDKKDFHTRDLARQGRRKIKVTSFSFPGLTPGCIIEWQSESIDKEGGGAQRISFQGSSPTRVFRVRYRPQADLHPSYKFTTTFIHCPSVSSPLGKDGYYSMEKTSIPALKTEPFMPPVDEVQQWMVLYMESRLFPRSRYFERYRLTPLCEYIEAFIEPPTTTTAKAGEKKSKKSPAQAPDIILDKALELKKDLTDDREILARIHDFCRSKIRPINRESSGFTPEELEKLKNNKTVAEVLERGYGDYYDITALFIALARAAGYNAWFALCADNSERNFDRNFLMVSSPSDPIAGVSLRANPPFGDHTLFYDPGAIYLAPEQLHWSNQGTGYAAYRRTSATTAKSASRSTVTSGGTKQTRDVMRVQWGNTPAATADGAIRKRTGTFRLDADGTLEGDVRLEPRGQYEYTTKHRYESQTADARAAAIRSDVLARLPNATVTDIVVLNASAPLEPVAITYHIRVPAYADMTGQRMFVQPAFFQKGAAAMFTSPERAHNIYLTHPWTEQDEVTITLPAGYVLEELSRAAPFPPSPNLSYSAGASFRKSTNTLTYKREFIFKAKEIKSTGYTALKTVFDGIHAQDNATLSIKRADAGGTPAAIETAQP